MKGKFRTRCFVALLIFPLSIPFPLRAGPPTDQVRSTVDNVIATLKDPRLKSESKKKERREQLRRLLYLRFDFTEMAKRSLGAHWRRRTPEEREEFVRLFRDLLEHAYIDRIEAYNDEELGYPREQVDGNYAEVESRVITRKGEEFSITYKLHLVDGDWKVYDIVIENISLVNNYRSQFNRVITNSSYEELIRRMKEKRTDFAEAKK